MRDTYVIPFNSTDLSAALINEAKLAEREGLHGLSKRQEAMAVHVQNAADRMAELCPAGHRVQMSIVFEVTPDVNPVLSREDRQRMADQRAEAVKAECKVADQ